MYISPEEEIVLFVLKTKSAELQAAEITSEAIENGFSHREVTVGIVRLEEKGLVEISDQTDVCLTKKGERYA